MSTNVVYPHLRCDDQGEMWIGNTRYKVAHLAAEHYQHGWTAEELLRQHPDLRPEEVYSALTYFYDNHESMVVSIKESLDSLDASRPPQPFTREQLLERRASEGA